MRGANPFTAAQGFTRDCAALGLSPNAPPTYLQRSLIAEVILSDYGLKQGRPRSILGEKGARMRLDASNRDDVLLQIDTNRPPYGGARKILAKGAPALVQVMV